MYSYKSSGKFVERTISVVGIEVCMAYKRLDFIDTARGLSILAVIIGHIISKQAPLLENINAFLYAFHLPLFFIISGFLFKADSSPKGFLLKKVKAYGIPYVFCSVVISCYYILIRAVDSGTGGLGVYILWMIKNFIVQTRFTVLWFLSVLFFAEILLYFFFVISKKKIVYMWIISVFFGISFMIYDICGLPALPWNIDTSFIVVPFLLFGFSLKKYNFFNLKIVEVSQITLLFLIFGVTCVAVNTYMTGGGHMDMFASQYRFIPFVLLAAFSLSLFFLLLSRKITIRSLRWLGANTMVFFAFHQAIGMDLSKRILSIFWNIDASESSLIMQILVVIVMLSLVLAICYTIHIAILKSGLGFLIGKKNPQPS